MTARLVGVVGAEAAAAAVTPVATISGGMILESTSAARYQRVYTYDGNNIANTSGAVDIPFRFAFRLVRFIARVNTNATTDDTEIDFQDDGTDLGTVTAGSGATGEFESGALTDDVAVDSLCNFKRDSVTTGNFFTVLMMVTFTIV